MKKLLPGLAAFFLLASFFSCKKDALITSPNARLILSADTIKFDTVFTTVGSITRSFTLVNDNDQPLRLSEIRLMGGSASPFRINVNGIASLQVNDLDLAANDSAYIFVNVTVNPNSANLPFVLSDSIRIQYNGNTRYVQLQAFGQNAHFIRNQVIRSHTSWPNDLPYVILGGLRVDTNMVLTLQPGVRIYAHADAPIIIDGTLNAAGTVTAPIVFTGDRRDEPYNQYPAAWPGIYFRGSSRNSQLKFTQVRNAYQAVVCQLPSLNSNPKLVIQQSVIDNAYSSGLLCIQSSVQVNNSLISNSASNIVIQAGGKYDFVNCTVASYSNNYLLHKTPVLSVANFIDQNGVILSADLDARFTNCIFWGEEGNLDNEVVVSKQGNTVFNVLFDHCLYKATADPANSTINNNLRNINPAFDSIDVSNKWFDFRISRNATAPGINHGAMTGFSKDLDDLNRNNGLPDLGAYEKQ